MCYYVGDCFFFAKKYKIHEILIVIHTLCHKTKRDFLEWKTQVVILTIEMHTLVATIILGNLPRDGTMKRRLGVENTVWGILASLSWS